MVREFTVLYSPGPAFAAGRKLQEQDAFDAQARWWKDHEAARKLRMIGVPAENPDRVIVVLYAESFEAAQALADSAPFVGAGILIARTVTGGVRRCIPPPV